LIAEYYGDRRAKRSGVPYINHITEGLVVMDRLGASKVAKDAYCVHPIFQDDATLYDDRGSKATFQGLLLWDAGRIVFNADALDASSVGRRMERLRERVLRRVASTYDARRRRLAELILAPPEKLRPLAEKTLQLQELEGVLDLLTDGRFTAALAADARRTDGASRTP
jgi:hypothetical protein